MSSPARGCEPRAPEDWGRRSLAELRETCRRQERLLRNEKFICKLPDKGKKVAATVAKLKAAIAEREEIRGRSELFHPVSLDCELRHDATARVDVDLEKAQNSDPTLDTSSPVPGCSSVDAISLSETTTDTPGLVRAAHTGSAEAVETNHTVTLCPASSTAAGQHLSQHCALSQAEDPSSSLDSLIIDKLQRITISDQSTHGPEGNTSTESTKGHPRGTPKTPHFIQVLETRAQSPVPPAHTFKTNVLPASRGKDSPARVSMSSEERRRCERQHLDDVTAARLRPLHHAPARLLPMAESLALQSRQRRSYEETQAKLAARRLAESADLRMRSYRPAAGADEDDDEF